MTNSVFEFSDYKAYLAAWIKSQPSKGHGQRGKIAAAIGVQTTFISQVLRGHAHLSLEQGERLNGLLGHSYEEAHFFLLLIQENRAGTSSLKAYFAVQMKQAIDSRLDLRNRLTQSQDMSLEDRSVYFSVWHYAAVHVLISIPKFQNKPAIAKALDIPIKKIGDILEFLVSRGLAAQEGDRFFVGPAHIHLGKDSPMILKHHTNWRLRALQSLENEKDDELHYSSVVSIAEGDAKKIRLFVENCG